MLKVRVREKHQVTLPMSIVRDAQIQQNDLLDIAYRNGVITISVKKPAQKQRSIADYVGITKGLYGKSAADVDTYLEEERNTWDR